MSEFKIPTEMVELPSKGLLYPEDSELAKGTIEIKYMTAKEEDILTNQSYIKNGTVLDKLIKSLIVSKINYDDLLMGLPNGDRILINDKKPNSIDNTAYSYNLVRNSGMKNLEFDLMDLKKRIEKPWGYEEIIEYNKNYVVKKLFMNEGHSCSTQYHELKMETIIVLEGKLRIYYGDEINSLNSKDYEKGEYITIQPFKIHKMFGITDCLYLETSTNELWDVIRLQDDYGRK